MTREGLQDQQWTIGKVLTWSTSFLRDRGQIDSPRLDAEVLLAHSLSMTRIQLYTEFDKPLSTQEREPFKDFLKRRSNGEPVAYITGVKEFMGYSFLVNPSVLIPRPDTEVLVEAALAALKSKENPRILDVGTGSGCIALSLALKRPDATVVAWDVDERALIVAQDNNSRLGGRVAFECCDALVEGTWDRSDSLGRFDLIVSNPPYIRPEEGPALSRSVRDFEPSRALFASPDGLLIYRTLATLAPKLQQQGGCLIVEIGSTQGPDVIDIFNAAGWRQSRCIKDWEKRDRVIQTEWLHE